MRMGKISSFRGSLTNKHVDVKLRLRLFGSVITPCVMYGLSTAPMVAADIEHLAATQRKMSRLMIGYVKGPQDTWADMHRRLNRKIDAALAKFPVRLWGAEIKKSKR